MRRFYRLRVAEPWQIDDWAALERTPLTTNSGRGEVWLLQHPNGTILERQYRHGGLRRLIKPQLFFRTRRAKREMAVHQMLFERGLNTVEPVGWSETKTKIPWIRQYFFYSVFLENSKPVPHFLSQRGLNGHGIRQVARILKDLYDAGIFHTDLNLNNWLVNDGVVYLIDFDKAVPRKEDRIGFLCACLARMARSGVKLGLEHRKYNFLRLVVASATLFDLNARDLLAHIPRQHTQKKFYHRARWFLSGGIRNKA